MKTKAEHVCGITSLLMIALISSAGLGEESTRSPSASDTGRDESVLSVGPGVIVRSQPYDGVGSDALAIPFITYRGRYLTVNGKELGVRVLEEEHFSIRALLGLRTEGYDSDDSRALDGMDDRDFAVDAGVGMTILLDPFTADVSFVNDISGRHDGHELRGRISYPFRGAFGISKLTMTPYSGLSWRSENLNDYYYGVEGDEARAGRPKYSAGDGLNPFVGLGIRYEVSSTWSAFFQVSCEWLDSEITESPIVSDHHVLSFMGGLVYRF